MLRKYIANPDVIVKYEPLKIQKGLTYVEELVKIMDKKEQVLCTKMIPIVKVLWCNRSVEDASWEVEQDMRNCLAIKIKICYKNLWHLEMIT